MKKDEFIIDCGGIQPSTITHGGFAMSNLTARDWNRIICAVNAKQTVEEAGLKTEEEIGHYIKIWDEAEELLAKYGDWPVFELVELE